MSKVLSIFLDTNIFLQCKPLKEIDWSELNHQGEIELIITRPVQTELDNFKGAGNSRQASRSRASASLLAELLDAPSNGLELRQKPTVRLRMMLQLKPDKESAHNLNYENNDDQLVGIALGYHKTQTNTTSLLLSDDSGPLFSAKSVELPYMRPPKSWLLPPELDEATRIANKLTEELKRYKSQEPSFKVEVSNSNSECLNLSYNIYSQATESETDSLLSKLYDHFPIATDFGPSEPWEEIKNTTRLMRSIIGEIKETFTPATADQISSYKLDYEIWKDACKDYLLNFHNQLNSALEWPDALISITNTGSRPANEAIIELDANGDIYIARPKYKIDFENDKSKEECFSLPKPPIAPRGNLKQDQISPSAFQAAAGLALNGTRANLFADIPDSFKPIESYYSPPKGRDPNSLYWGSGAEDVPSKHLSLNCKQWRHARESEDFTVGLCFPKIAGTYSGRLSVSVHATNLTNPTVKLIPIQVTVVEQSPVAEIDKKIQQLPEKN